MAIHIEPLPPAATDDDTGEPRMRSPRMRARQNEAIAAAVMAGLDRVPALKDRPRRPHLPAALAAFLECYDHRPVKDNRGGSGFNDSLWLFAIAFTLGPACVLESGVHKGHTTWVLRQAAPSAEIHCFDVDLSNTVYRDGAARYHQGDWSEVALPLDPDSTLAFFDDHISHARRLREASDRGLRHIAFDDNFPAHLLHLTGGPPVPTLAMMTDASLPESGTIEWSRKGKLYSYAYRRKDFAAAMPANLDVHAMPELAPITRASTGSYMTFVELQGR